MKPKAASLKEFSRLSLTFEINQSTAEAYSDKCKSSASTKLTVISLLVLVMLTALFYKWIPLFWG